jgi:ligand-binding sensor domain-containing protein
VRAFLVILICCTFSVAGGSAGAATEGSQTFFFQDWQTEEGLPDNAVNDISQTPDGYLWLATLKGLVRFDGTRFRTFTPRDSPCLRSAQVRRLLAGRDGTLWIAAGAGGVSALRGGRFTSHDYPTSVASEVVDAIGEAPDGSIWNTTWVGPVLHLVHGKAELFERQNTEGSHFNRWIMTEDQELELASGASLVAQRGDVFAPIWTSDAGSLAAAPRSAGGHWFVDGRHLRIYKDSVVSKPIAELPEMTPVRAMLEDRAGALWLGTEGSGVFRFAAGRFSKIATSHASVRALFEDREGNLWVGTGGGGLNKIRQRQIEVRDRDSGLASEVALSLCEDSAGAIWCITQGGAVSSWAAADPIARALPGASPAKAVSICATADGSLWIGTDGEGLARIKDGITTTYRVKDGLGSDYVSMLAVDGDSKLLIETVQGLARFAGGRFVTIATRETLHDGVRALASDALGRVWVGSGDGLLHCFSAGGQVTYGTAEGLPGAVIRCLLPTEDGSLWIGTDGDGLCRWREGKLTCWTSHQGLWDNVITQLQIDASGNFWCGSPRGLFRVNRQQLEDVAAGRAALAESTHYGRSDGVPNYRYASEFHPRSLRASDGRLFFSTQKGVVVIDPTTLRENPIAPVVAIEQIRVDEQVIQSNPGASDGGAPLQIAAGARSVEFTFAALSFTSPDKVRVRYRLEGLEADWREASGSRSASYLHLAPGSYRFQVVACNDAGIWNMVGAAQPFVVLAHFWQSSWFIAFSLLIFAAGVALAARWWALLRVRRQVRQMAQRHAVEQERTRIAKDLHDELGSSLTQVTLLSSRRASSARR